MLFMYALSHFHRFHSPLLLLLFCSGTVSFISKQFQSPLVLPLYLLRYCLCRFQTVHMAPAVTGYVAQVPSLSIPNISNRPAITGNVQVLHISFPNGSSLPCYYRYVAQSLCLSFPNNPGRLCSYGYFGHVLSVSYPSNSIRPYFTGMLLRYCLSHFHTLPVAPAITGMLLRYCLSHLQTVDFDPAINYLLLSYCLYLFQIFPLCIISKRVQLPLLLPLSVLLAQSTFAELIFLGPCILKFFQLFS